jgi:hypothetical protein
MVSYVVSLAPIAPVDDDGAVFGLPGGLVPPLESRPVILGADLGVVSHLAADPADVW